MLDLSSRNQLIKYRYRKFFPIILVLHFVLGTAAFYGAFSLYYLIEYKEVVLDDFNSLLRTSVLCSFVNLTLPVYLYFKFKNES